VPGNVPIANSGYLDLTAYRATTQSSVEAAYDLDPSKVSLTTAANFTPFTVALVLDRNQDPTTLLGTDWADRQQTLGALNSAGTLWSTYGASQADFNAVVADLHSQSLTVVDSSNAAQYGNYVTSAASRTVWVAIDTPAEFQTLFGTPLYTYSNPGGANDGMTFWNGNLSVPASWNVDGLWIDRILEPPTADQAPGTPVTLAQGPQSPGNDSSTPAALSPNQLAAAYNFPLLGQSVQTGTIGLVESGIGGALPTGQTASFQDLLTQYLQSVGVVGGTGTVYVQGADGQRYNADSAYERSADVGVAAAINPNSTIGLYTGSGVNGDPEPDPYTEFVALQDAIWDTSQNPAVISTSFFDDQFTAPDSPFRRALDQLFVDAALRNESVFQAAGDWGSGVQVGNGLPNLITNDTSAYDVLVGGTSISSLSSAGNDPSLDASIVAPALDGDPATIWQLVAGGLTVLPKAASSLTRFVETVWNDYFANGTTVGSVRGSASGYITGQAAPGGVDPDQPVPSYQTAYGLTPTTSDPSAQIGRGDPDVSADTGGNTSYNLPNNDMVGTVHLGGTSLSAPLWASLAVQVNAVFQDQGLPALGYMNDLLYTAAVIDPASFNDVTIGNNTSSFTYGGPDQTKGSSGSEVAITPTGFGYSAGPGYDLASGLGTPNGLLLTRTLTTIAHAETSYADVPGVIESSTGGAWTSGADQSVVIQTNSGSNIDVGVGVGSSSVSYASSDAAPTPGPAPSPSSRCSPTSIPASSPCSTGSHRARRCKPTSPPATA
jgi:hypothetical protein